MKWEFRGGFTEKPMILTCQSPSFAWAPSKVSGDMLDIYSHVLFFLKFTKRIHFKHDQFRLLFLPSSTFLPCITLPLVLHGDRTTEASLGFKEEEVELSLHLVGHSSEGDNYLRV